MKESAISEIKINHKTMLSKCDRKPILLKDSDANFEYEKSNNSHAVGTSFTVYCSRLEYSNPLAEAISTAFTVNTPLFHISYQY